MEKQGTYDVCPDKYNADEHGEKHPTGPKSCIETVEKIRYNNRGNDHRRRKLVTGDVISIVPGRRREITIKENEVDNGRLRDKRHSLMN
jgi:hypothetical protein